MLKKDYRLRKKSDIDIVFEHGRFVGGDMVNAKVWHINETQFPKRGYRKEDLKIAIVVGKAVSKSAVARNRVKRQMREAVRLLVKDNRLRSGNMLILIAKGNTLGKAYADIKKSITQLLTRARLLQ